MRTWESLSEVEKEILADVRDDSYSFAEEWNTVLNMSPRLDEHAASLLFRSIIRSFWADGLIKLTAMDTDTTERFMTAAEAEAVISNDAIYEVNALRSSHYIRIVASEEGDRLGMRPTNKS